MDEGDEIHNQDLDEIDKIRLDLERLIEDGLSVDGQRRMFTGILAEMKKRVRTLQEQIDRGYKLIEGLKKSVIRYAKEINRLQTKLNKLEGE